LVCGAKRGALPLAPAPSGSLSVWPYSRAVTEISSQASTRKLCSAVCGSTGSGRGCRPEQLGDKQRCSKQNQQQLKRSVAEQGDLGQHAALEQAKQSEVEAERHNDGWPQRAPVVEDQPVGDARREAHGMHSKIYTENVSPFCPPPLHKDEKTAPRHQPEDRFISA